MNSVYDRLVAFCERGYFFIADIALIEIHLMRQKITEQPFPITFRPRKYSRLRVLNLP